MKSRFSKLSLILVLTSAIVATYILKDKLKLNKFGNWSKAMSAEPHFKLEDALGKKNIIPIAIIGSGPAGLSAALYGARAAIFTVVFEGKKPGGQLTETTYVENWPGTPKLLGSELINLNRKQAEKFGALMVNDTIEYVDFSSWPFKLRTEDGNEIYALSVIICTGSNPKLLNVPGESKYWGYGVTTCAVCDAPLYKDKDVVVLGGGDSAIEEATLLSSYAKNVTMLVRGDKLRAAPTMRDRLKNINNIKVIYNTQITEIVGDDKVVHEVKLKNNKDNSISTMKIDGVFLAIGHTPSTEIFKKFISLDKAGYIDLKSRRQETSVLGVFAAGDATDPRYRQAGTSAGDGIKSALDAINFLQEHGFNDNFAHKLEPNYFDPHASSTKPLKSITTEKELDDAVKKSKFLILEIGAEHCVSCKNLSKALESSVPKFENKVDFIYVDLDKTKDFKDRFEIKSIPVLLIFKDGKLINKYNRAFSKHELFTTISRLLNEE